jgi:hypothetical protein
LTHTLHQLLAWLELVPQPQAFVMAVMRSPSQAKTRVIYAPECLGASHSHDLGNQVALCRYTKMELAYAYTQFRHCGVSRVSQLLCHRFLFKTEEGHGAEVL